MKYAIVIAALILALGGLGAAYIATRPKADEGERVCVEYEPTMFGIQNCKRFEYR